METRSSSTNAPRVKSQNCKLSLHTYGKEPECVYLAKAIKAEPDLHVRGLVLRRAGSILGNTRRILKDLAFSTVTLLMLDNQSEVLVPIKVNNSVQAAMDGYIFMRKAQLLAADANKGLPIRYSRMILRAILSAKKTYLRYSKELLAEHIPNQVLMSHLSEEVTAAPEEA